MAANSQTSDNSSKLVPSLNLVQFDVPVKGNNYFLDVTPSKYDEQFRPILDFFTNCELNDVLTKHASDIPLRFVQQWWYSSEYDDEKEGLVGHIDLGEQSLSIRITPQTLTRRFNLLTTTDLQIETFEKPPTQEVLLQFLQHLGYNKEITRLSQFRRQYLPPKWNFMFSVLNRTITCKIGSQDQTHPAIIAIMYALFFNRSINMAHILFCEMLTAVDKKNKDLAKGKQPISVLFPRFISVVIQRAMEKFSITEEGPMTPLFVMNSFKATEVPPYPHDRRFPHTMIEIIPADSPTHLLLRRVAQSSEPMMGSPTHLGSEPEHESESDISDTAQNINRAQPEGGSERVRKRKHEDPPSDEENNSVRAEEGEHERFPEGEFLNIESEGGEVEKDVLDDTNERIQSPNPSANKFTVQDGPTLMDIETEVHTSNPSHPNRSEASDSASDACTRGETSDTAKSSQKDLDQDKNTHLPQSMSPPPTHDAFVAQTNLDRPLERKDCLSEKEWHDLIAQGILSLDNKVSKHIRFSSSDSDSDDQRPIGTIIGRSLKKGPQGLMGSPSGDNLKPPPTEGPSELEGNLESCVDPKVTPSDYVTKEEFKIFGDEIRESLKEIKLQMEKTSEASASNSEVEKLTSEVSELRTTILNQTKKLDALESLVIKNDSVLSREIQNSTTEILQAIPPTSAPTPTHADFSQFKEEILRSLTEVIAKIPTTSADAPATTEFITKADLTNFSKKITSNVMNISSKFVSKTSKQNKKIEDLLKNIKSSEGVLKRKEPEVTCSEEARKKARYEDSDDGDDQPQGTSDLLKGEKTPTPKPVETHKEKGTEKHSTSTSAEDTQATLKSPVPIIFLGPSTAGAPIVPITVEMTTANQETIGALDEDEAEQLVDFSTSEDAFSSPERPTYVMRDAYESESEQEEKSESEKEEKSDSEKEVEVVDVEEYVFKNAQPHHTSTTSELRESPEIDGYISEPSKEDPPQTMEPETMVADEQAPSENPVQKASIGIPAKVFHKPPTFLESNPEASIEDHFRYIYCEFNMADTLVIPLNPRIREDMPDYERRFIRDKTKPRAQVLFDDPIIKINKISEKTFAYNKIIYRNYVVTRSDQKIYEFNDNDLVNLNPYDLPHLYAYCSARYDHGRREIRMGMVEVRRAMEAYVKHRAKRDFQIALNLGEEKLEVTEPMESFNKLKEQKTGSIVAEPLGFVFRINQKKKIFLASEVSKYSDETLRGIKKLIHAKEERHKADLLAKLDLEIDSMINFRALIMKFHGIYILSGCSRENEDIRDGFIRGSEDNVRALKTFSLDVHVRMKTSEMASSEALKTMSEALKTFSLKIL
ncbi:hypothetical protein L6452_01748 [Arctium lappa]|uniref:Uncharacterized protein n=1 Tax=Arctium lappa TaxID=4217 RepID=A0ACB9FI57_ARCLA|nr:hypothetical protein L6452_01748 [Arctium lappa]